MHGNPQAIVPAAAAAAVVGASARRCRKSAPRASKRTGIAPAAWAPSMTTRAPRAWAISAIRATGITAPVVHRTCEIETRRVSGGDRGIERRDRARLVAIGTGIDEDDVDPHPVAERDQRTEGAAVLVGVVTIRPPAASRAAASRRSSRRSWRGSADRVDIGPDAGPPRRPVPRPSARGLEQVIGVGAPDVALPDRELGHRRGGLGRERADRAGVEVDPGRRGPEGPPGRPPASPGRA